MTHNREKPFGFVGATLAHREKLSTKKIINREKKRATITNENQGAHTMSGAMNRTFCF